MERGKLAKAVTYPTPTAVPFSTPFTDTPDFNAVAAEVRRRLGRRRLQRRVWQQLRYLLRTASPYLPIGTV